MKKTIAASAKFLDKKMPGWAKKIKVTTLVISSDAHCIMGQLGKGDPQVALDKLELTVEKAENMGFIDNGVEDLDELWKAEVRKRIAKKT